MDKAVFAPFTHCKIPAEGAEQEKTGNKADVADPVNFDEPEQESVIGNEVGDGGYHEAEGNAIPKEIPHIANEFYLADFIQGSRFVRAEERRVVTFAKAHHAVGNQAAFGHIVKRYFSGVGHRLIPVPVKIL
jgi:hypothetical protein